MKMRKPYPLTESFRKALMKEHAHDWDMETVAEAAYILSEVAAQHIDKQVVEARIDELDKMPRPFNDGLHFSYWLDDRLATLKDTLKGGSDATK